MAKDIYHKIIQAKNQFQNKQGKPPTKLHLTIDNECELGKILPKISESLAEKAFTKGVRIAVPKIVGCQVVYGAKTFMVE